MTREEGIELVKKYDHVRPSTLDNYLDFLEISEKQFYDWVEPMRDLDVWEKDGDGRWKVKDSVVNHLNDPDVDSVRPEPVKAEDRTFSEKNSAYFWDEGMEKLESIRDVRGFHIDDEKPIVL
jgi:hypothetical protein